MNAVNSLKELAENRFVPAASQMTWLRHELFPG
jgi:hypothetical protein